MVKNLPANAGAAGDTGSIPESGRSRGGGNGNLLQYPYREIPRTEEPGRLQSMDSQRVGHLSIPFVNFYQVFGLKLIALKEF